MALVPAWCQADALLCIRQRLGRLGQLQQRRAAVAAGPWKGSARGGGGENLHLTAQAGHLRLLCQAALVAGGHLPAVKLHPRLTTDCAALCRPAPTSHAPAPVEHSAAGVSLDPLCVQRRRLEVPPRLVLGIALVLEPLGCRGRLGLRRRRRHRRRCHAAAGSRRLAVRHRGAAAESCCASGGGGWEDGWALECTGVQRGGQL